MQAAEAIDAAVPAVLSVVFASPLAGLVYPMEEEAEKPAYEFKRSTKITLYVASACGALAAAAMLSLLCGGGEGLPRFGAMQASTKALVWVVPLIACGYLLSLVVRVATKGAQRIARALEGKTVLKPVLCGLGMGCVALALPNVLFSGEAETGRIMTEWATVGAGVLMLTGVAKAVITPLCLNMGWSGGSFFPSIYAGVSFGYGAAALLGLDPVLCAGVVTAAMMGSTMEKPLIALALLAMCFPMQGIVWLGVAAIVGSAVPVPKVLK